MGYEFYMAFARRLTAVTTIYFHFVTESRSQQIEYSIDSTNKQGHRKETGIISISLHLYIYIFRENADDIEQENCVSGIYTRNEEKNLHTPTRSLQ